METRFIDGGEYVDRQTYISVRDENSQLRERIAKLEAETKLRKKAFPDLYDHAIWQASRIKKLRARLDAAESPVRIARANAEKYLTDMKATTEWMAMQERIKELQAQISTFDCRFAGEYADLSGSHCPIDKPCMRCRNELLQARLDAAYRSLEAKR